MSKFNTTTARTAVRSPVTSGAVPSGVTYEGAPGYARSAKSELFLLAAANMGSEDTFYESAKARDSRYARLVRQVAVDDLPWLAGFLPWLRSEANMRTAPLIGAAETVKALTEAGKPGGRKIVASVLQRADEPGEMLAYWHANYGRNEPKPLKRGIADAVTRLYTEYALLRYDTASHGYRFADVIERVHVTGEHPEVKGTWKGDLYGHAIDRRHNRDNPVPESLTMIRANSALRARAAEDRAVLLDADALKAAGMTWEDALSLAGNRLDKAALWAALIPSMGYMACLAEGTPVWLADGTTAPIEEVVARKLPVLSYDKEWDARPVKYGANQGSRDHSTGNLVPTVPSAWLDTGVRPVAAVRFASGRLIEATYDHRWVRQRRGGRQAWEWTTTGELRVGDRIPAPLTAAAFGDEGDAWDGYFVGAMLGDGGMTSLTPEFHGDPDDGAVAFLREYAAKHGCGVREDANGTIVRMRFPFKQWKRNPLAEILRRYEVWGKRCEVKALPGRPFSREFWIGALSGLIDTDGCVRERTNPKGTLHGSVEYATVSRRLALQVSDALLRLGVTSIVREHAPRSRPGAVIQSRHPLFVVEVNRATALVRLADLLDLRIGYKAALLASLAARLAHVTPASSEMHGYDAAVTLDRVVAIEDAGECATYCVTVDTSSLFVANGIVTGNCLRNLRNFDEAGVPDDIAETVAARLADREQVAKSRQFPFRFLSAYRAAPSLRWGHPLDKALTASLGNVPALKGRTLVLVDTSGSMNAGFSKDGTLMRWDAAALFGVALGHRCDRADVVSFSGRSYYHEPQVAVTKPFPLARGESLLRSLDRWKNGGWFIGAGTDTALALRACYGGHDRVVIVTDEQAANNGAEVSDSIPSSVPLYTWNLAGYQHGHAPSGSGQRHTFGGLTDSAFAMIPLLESGRDGRWPWEYAAA